MSAHRSSVRPSARQLLRATSGRLRQSPDRVRGYPGSGPPYRVVGARAWWLLSLVAVVGLGVLLGLAVVVAGPMAALAGAAGVLLAALAFTHAEVVIVVVFALASGLLPSRLNPFVSLPVGSLQASDLLLLVLLGVVVVRVAVEGRGHPPFKFRRTPLDVPLLLFFGSVLVGLGVAVLGYGVNLSHATYEVRMLSYYLIFFAVTNLVRTRAQLVRLIRGLVAAAVLMAVLMLVTSAVGEVPGYTESWALQEEGVARVFHPGFTVVYVGLIVVMAYSALGEVGRRPHTVRLEGRKVEWGREVRWLVVAVLALGLLSTLARNVLVSGAVSFGLLFVALRHRERVRLVEMLTFIGFLSALLVAGLLVAGEAGSLLRYADLYLERITRMFSADIVAEGENLQPRWLEIQYAWEKLKGSPILGIGLYNPYRPAFYVGEPVQLRHFLHNAYLALWIKMGLPGLLSFFWLSALFVKRAFENWGRAEGRLLRAAALGSAVAFVGLLISNFVAPTFVQPGSLAVFGLIFGINEALFFTAQEMKEGGIGDGDEK